MITVGEIVGLMKDQRVEIKLIGQESKSEIVIVAGILKNSLGRVTGIKMEGLLCLEVDERIFNQFARLL